MTADDLLTQLATIPQAERAAWLQSYGLKILREAADLCGQDAETMTKRQAIVAIIENF